jgi:hypothetical protein
MGRFDEDDIQIERVQKRSFINSDLQDTPNDLRKDSPVD